VCYRFFSSEVYTCVLGWQGVTLYFFFVDTNPAALSGEYIYICPTVTFCMKQVKASHILVKTESEAEKILEDLKKGASFEKIAKEKSECPSKKRGGSLGWFGRGKMVPALTYPACGRVMTAAPARCDTRAVSSSEPSSTTMTSSTTGITSAITFAILSASLYAGITAVITESMRHLNFKRYWFNTLINTLYHNNASTAWIENPIHTAFTSFKPKKYPSSPLDSHNQHFHREPFLW
jgi:hypothetical protein